MLSLQVEVRDDEIIVTEVVKQRERANGFIKSLPESLSA